MCQRRPALIPHILCYTTLEKAYGILECRQEFHTLHLGTLANADAGPSYQDSATNPQQALRVIRNNDIPHGLQHLKGSLEKAFVWLIKRAMDD